MNSADSAPTEHWSSALIPLCNRFRAALRAGQTPRIVAALPLVPDAGRPALLRALLVIEREERGAAGAPAEYRRRFPAHAAVVDEGFPPGDGLRLSDTAVRPVSAGDVTGAWGSAAGAMAPPAGGRADGPRLPAVPGYQVRRVLGRGGMGVVYEARQAPLNRPVALKMVLDADYATTEDRVRFLAEAEAIARLRHPNIVQIYEVGEHDGHPFLALEYLEGGSLAGRPLPLAPAEAARLVAVLARAMDHAHGQHLVHRDLKPANILMAADGTPKVTDFGLARRTDAATGLTASGTILGTPAYMDPEQADGKGRHATPAADIYSLGAILYDLLTGQPPFRGASATEVVVRVLAEEPPHPTALRPGLPSDLVTVCLKCLEKEPARRYPTAGALADDLGRFLAGEPVRARRVGELERAWKWARRRPALAGALTAAVLALVAGTAVATWFAVEAGAQAAAAERARSAAEHQEQAARREAERANTAERQALRDAARFQADRGLAKAAAGEVAAGLHDLVAALGQAEAARDVALADALRRNLAAWGPLTPALTQILSLPDRARALVFSPDGATLAVAVHDRTVRLFDVATAHPGRVWQLDRPVTRLAFHPEGRLLAAGEEARDANDRLGAFAVHCWDVVTGQAVGVPRKLPGWIQGVAFSPDGRWVALGGDDGSLRLWDVATRQPLGPPVGHQAAILDLAFTPDGRSVVTVAANGHTRAWPVPEPLAEPDLARLEWQLQVLTGLRRDASQGTVILPASAWAAARAEMARRGAVRPPAPPLAVWAEANAADAEEAGDAFAACWYLDRAEALAAPEGLAPLAGALAGVVACPAGSVPFAWAAAWRRPAAPWHVYARRAAQRFRDGRPEAAAADLATATLVGSPDVLKIWHQDRAAVARLRGEDQLAAWHDTAGR